MTETRGERKERTRRAILDAALSLGEDTSLAVAGACKARGISVIFTTGLSPDDYGQFCDGNPVLNKPFTIEDLTEALEAVDRH